MRVAICEHILVEDFSSRRRKYSAIVDANFRSWRNRRNFLHFISDNYRVIQQQLRAGNDFPRLAYILFHRFLFEIRCWRARTCCNYRRIVGWSKRWFQGERYIVVDIETFICMPYANCLVSSLVSTDVRVFLSRLRDDIDVENCVYIVYV